MCEMSTIQILVVDDHAVVRRVMCSLLSSDPLLSVICEAADGEQAVQQAEELHPDMILLDISLPGISGIEAAKRIRRVSPNSQIIFLSQHDSLQMVKDALRTGGHGYVAKIDAGSELLKAIRERLGDSNLKFFWEAKADAAERVMELLGENNGTYTLVFSSGHILRVIASRLSPGISGESSMCFICR